MAASVIEPNRSAEAELTEEQIESLLQQAEARLQGRPVTNQGREEPSAQGRRTNTHPSVSALPPLYVSFNASIAHTDPKRLLATQDRKLANSIRKVEDPVTLKQKRLEVRHAALRSNLKII